MSSAISAGVRGGVPLGWPTYAREERGGRGPSAGSGGGMVILGEIALGAGALYARSGGEAADDVGSLRTEDKRIPTTASASLP